MHCHLCMTSRTHLRKLTFGSLVSALLLGAISSGEASAAGLALNAPRLAPVHVFPGRYFFSFGLDLPIRSISMTLVLRADLL